MRYLTATEAAKRIGVAEKTVRLWVKEGKLEALHPAKNRLAIAEEDVERIAQERQLYYTQPAPTSIIRTQQDVSVQVELGILKQKVSRLEKRVTELEQEVRTLTRPVTPSPPTGPQKPPVSIVSSHPSTPTTQPQNRTTDANKDIPEGWILCSDFFESHDIKETTYRRWLANGLAGEHFDFEEKPIAGTTKKYRYFTQDQKEAAVELLKKHSKI